jgi:enoyl-CoA hydratase/carnithine racemase
MTEFIKIERTEDIVILTLDRIEKKNALTDAMYGVLADQLAQAETDPAARVVVIRAEGDMFTSGNDVGEFAAAATGGAKPQNVSRFIRALSSASRPIVAAVQGRAVGVGTTMLLHCDYVVLGEDAQLITPFVNLALVPEAGSTLLLPARIGHARAFEMFALGEPVSAQAALNWGIANRVVPNAELTSTATDVAKRLARQPIGSLSATKRLMRNAEAITVQIGVESAQFVERLGTDEAREAFMAFAQRRAPDFSKFR